MKIPSNQAFFDTAFRACADGEAAWVAGFPGDPANGRWGGQAVTSRLPACIGPEKNNYVCVSTFRPGPDGELRRRKTNFGAMHVVMVDDVGTKVPKERIALEPSVLVETSPGNFQAWYFLDPPETNRSRAELLVDRMIEAGLSADAKDPGMRGVTRYGRLPIGVNAKPAVVAIHGKAFAQTVPIWRPDVRFSLESIADAYSLDLTPTRSKPRSVPRPSRSAEDLVPIIEGLGLYVAELPGLSEAHQIVCPWVHEHTNRDESGTVYFGPSEDNAWRGGFKCHHGHCMHRGIREFQHFLRAVGRIQEEKRRAA